MLTAWHVRTGCEVRLREKTEDGEHQEHHEIGDHPAHVARSTRGRIFEHLDHAAGSFGRPRLRLEALVTAWERT